MLNTILQDVDKFGYLRNKDIAGKHFGDDLRKAQRATALLVASGQLIERRIGNSNRFCLPGQAALLDNVTGHRDASNAILIDALATGFATGVITDRQIQLNQAEHTLNGKIPDGLLLDEYEDPDGSRVDYSWVEVENSERSGRDVHVLGDWLINTFTSTRNWHLLPEYRRGYLARVIIAISATAADKIESRLLGYIKRECTSPAHAQYIRNVLPQRILFIRV